MANRNEHPTDPLFYEPETDDLSTHRHRVIVGVLGAALPLLIWFVAWLRPVDPALPVPMGSISAYYYSGAVAIFAGILAALAIYFVTYGGYDNPDRWMDRIAALVAALAATGVALFPADAPLQQLVLPWWRKEMATLHFISAGALFGAFIFFALFLFPKSRKAKERLPADKRLRNAVYRSCGIVMLVCIVWAGIRAQAKQEIFWLETIALEAFALSWLVKGRADWTAMQLLRRGRHPVKLAVQILDVTPRNGPKTG
jgi:hypothetical protein